MLDDDGTLMFRCGLESKSLVASLELLENDNESDTNTVLYLKNTKIIIKATKTKHWCWCRYLNPKQEDFVRMYRLVN